MEFDAFMDSGANRAGYSYMWLGLHTNQAVSWSPGGFSGLDRLLIYEQNAYGSGAYRLYHNVDRSGTPYEWRQTVPRGEWHHVQVQFCGPNGYSVQVTRKSDGSTILNRSDPSADLRIPGDVTDVYLQIGAQGQGKAVDNLRVTRGCGG